MNSIRYALAAPFFAAAVVLSAPTSILMHAGRLIVGEG